MKELENLFLLFNQFLKKFFSKIKSKFTLYEFLNDRLTETNTRAEAIKLNVLRNYKVTVYSNYN